MKITELLTGSREGKTRYRALQGRLRALPANYRMVAEACERFTMYLGPGDGENVLQVLEDFADFFEGCVADQRTVQDAVGDDPVTFVEDFLKNYPQMKWVTAEQQRLIDAVQRAEAL